MEENLAAKLCLLLGEQASKGILVNWNINELKGKPFPYLYKAVQWKLLGQEKDGSLLLGWIEAASSETDVEARSVIGRYNRLKDDLQILHKFSKVINLVQATVNQFCSLLGCVTKQIIMSPQEMQVEEEEKDCSEQAESSSNLGYYQAFIVEFKTENTRVHLLDKDKSKQIRIQFLYKQRPSKSMDKLLLLVHQEYVQMATLLHEPKGEIYIVRDIKKETLVKSFIWAQWDARNQVLYHIHHRRAAPVSMFTEEDFTATGAGKKHKLPCASPTLSGFQFHDDLPHETVLNIPLNLPQTPSSDNCGTYEDDVIPLRIHDCSLDLMVISDHKGIICVCHHYLYRPVPQPPQHQQHNLLSDSSGADVTSDANTVHFAYSVTLLHHSRVIHCVIPGIPWARARLMRPTFALYGDSHMVVFVQNCFTHLLEIGLHHKPSCHILCGPLTNVPGQSSYLVPLFNDLTSAAINGTDETTQDLETRHTLNDSSTNIPTIDLPTLDLVFLNVSTNFLIDVFKKETTSTRVRLGVLHYFSSHKNDLDVIGVLVTVLAEKPRARDLVKIMREFLISGAHSMVQKNLPSDVAPLLTLVPVTTAAADDDDYTSECSNFEARINDLIVTLGHEKLWNTCVMLLSPQQRLVPYQSDLWTRLWDLLSKSSGDDGAELPRFKPSRAAEKLAVSLACYQPEALSRCTTPISPSGGSSIPFGELMGSRQHKYGGGGGDSGLPFIEMESCTASKQEHIIAVNLRELSLHLLQYGTTKRIGLGPCCTPLHVHAMSTRLVASQLETSRLLCQMLCRAASVDARVEPERGFCLIDQLDDSRRWLLFNLLERYRYATESIAFPVPQGFMSFFTYLGYRTLKYSMFLQYIRRSVFELQVDVAKIIMADIGDTKPADLSRKLELLSLLPRTRANRLLNQWSHPMSLMFRAREHAANILSGELSQSRSRKHSQHRYHHGNGISAFPSTTDRLSPLDTFLDLLTAKASLTELDFGLLIEATSTSSCTPTEDFFNK